MRKIEWLGEHTEQEFTIEGKRGLAECIDQSIGNEYGYICPNCGDYVWSGYDDLNFRCNKCGKDLVRIAIDLEE